MDRQTDLSTCTGLRPEPACSVCSSTEADRVEAGGVTLYRWFGRPTCEGCVYDEGCALGGRGEPYEANPPEWVERRAVVRTGRNVIAGMHPDNMRDACREILKGVSGLSVHPRGAKKAARLLVEEATKGGGDALALVDRLVAEYAAALSASMAGASRCASCGHVGPGSARSCENCGVAL